MTIGAIIIACLLFVWWLNLLADAIEQSRNNIIAESPEWNAAIEPLNDRERARTEISHQRLYERLNPPVPRFYPRCQCGDKACPSHVHLS